MMLLDKKTASTCQRNHTGYTIKVTKKTLTFLETFIALTTALRLHINAMDSNSLSNGENSLLFASN